MRAHKIHLFYKEALPASTHRQLQNYFMDTVAAYIQVADITDKTDFFPENNKVYLLVCTEHGKKNRASYVVSIPSDFLSRFYALTQNDVRYIVFLDDILKLCLPRLFPDVKVISCHSFKITRDAELNLQDEFVGNLAKQIEQKILQRDFGQATRFLYEPGIPKKRLEFLKRRFGLTGANFIKGGTYHNLKDLSTLPLNDPALNYAVFPRVDFEVAGEGGSIFHHVKQRDILLHLPYHSYNTVLRFFNEAAIDPFVTKIYLTMYRVANDSRIVNALISAAKNGKKVTVFVELKARFDEANNIRWSKEMKAAGVRIIASIPGLKVHAKLALVKRKIGKQTDLFGLLSTGNFNETTAQFYTDHILLSAHKPILKEAERLFHFLKEKKEKYACPQVSF